MEVVCRYLNKTSRATALAGGKYSIDARQKPRLIKSSQRVATPAESVRSPEGVEVARPSGYTLKLGSIFSGW